MTSTGRLSATTCCRNFLTDCEKIWLQAVANSSPEARWSFKGIMKTKLPSTREYAEFVTELKQRIASARLHAARAVNQDLVLLYWDIGRGILERQEKLGWGQSVVEMLSRDLQKAFPGLTGFSAANLWRMRQFYSACTTPKFLAQAAQKLLATTPCGHHFEMLNKVKDPAAHILAYARKVDLSFVPRDGAQR